MKVFVSILLLCSCLSSLCAQNTPNRWNKTRQTFEMPAYNLKWDLSEISEWRVADSNVLPDNMLFCGAAEDVVVSLIAIKKEGNTSIADGAEDFINGFLSTALAETKIFPGLNRGTTSYKKCHFMFKDAIRFKAIEKVKDARLGTDKAVKFVYGGYVFEKDGMVFIPTVLLPFQYIEDYGDAVMELFFQKLSYINASKELHKK